MRLQWKALFLSTGWKAICSTWRHSENSCSNWWDNIPQPSSQASTIKPLPASTIKPQPTSISQSAVACHHHQYCGRSMKDLIGTDKGRQGYLWCLLWQQFPAMGDYNHFSWAPHCNSNSCSLTAYRTDLCFCSCMGAALVTFRCMTVSFLLLPHLKFVDV